MPKAARSVEDLARERDRILDAACDIICVQGFEQFSMRKLASRVGMTATNLYNYFSGKDEIYLAIQTRGFAELYSDFEEAAAGGPSALIDAYLAFGARRKDYYDIMFCWNTPKFADYLGTNLELQARIEKESGLKVAVLTESVLRSYAPQLSDAEAGFQVIQLWTSLHGVVNLLNSRVLPEVVVDPQAYINRLRAELLSRLDGGRDEHL